MKIKVLICDICKKRTLSNEGDLRIKYRAKRKWNLFYESGWERVDICSNCLDKIISVKEENDNEDKL